MKRKFLIDTDTASDDAVALLMALRHPDVEVVAITVVSGNVPLAQGVVNALVTAELCDSKTPVFAGADKPLTRQPQYAEWFHGKDGMGDQNYPSPKRGPEATHAVDAIIKILNEDSDIEVITLGPLTNLALALKREPDLANRVKRCVIMGGAPCMVGNVTPAAEYNIWVDPEAAQIVFRSGLPIEMVGWHLCRGKANLNLEDIELVRGFDTPYGHFTIDCNRTAMEANRIQSGEIGISLPDPTTMAIAIDSSICTESSRHLVEIETQSELTRGMTVVDQLNVANDERNREVWRLEGSRPREPNATICWKFDVSRWKALLYRLLQ